MSIERRGVFQAGVDRQQRGYAAMPGMRTGGPGEVHELPVLVDDVRAEVVEELSQLTRQGRP